MLDSGSAAPHSAEVARSAADPGVHCVVHGRAAILDRMGGAMMIDADALIVPGWAAGRGSRRGVGRRNREWRLLLNWEPTLITGVRCLIG
jgi:hypothetical protein